MSRFQVTRAVTRSQRASSNHQPPTPTPSPTTRPQTSSTSSPRQSTRTFEVTPAVTRSQTTRSSTAPPPADPPAHHHQLSTTSNTRRGSLQPNRQPSASQRSTIHSRSWRTATVAARRRNRHRQPRTAPTSQQPPQSHNSSSRLGVWNFNSPDLTVPQTSSFRYPLLTDERNVVCELCDSVLWWEERRYNCCNDGQQSIHPLAPIDPSLLRIFESPRFKASQRAFNNLFSFTALGAGGLRKRTWTNPSPPSMLTMHGRAYHRIFDLQERYKMLTTVNNNARFYIYDAEFANITQQQQLDRDIANRLRTHIHSNVPWARQYRSAVDEVINTPDDSSSLSSGPAFIEFAEVSRVNDGNVVGNEVSAPEIAAILYKSSERPNSHRTVVTYPKNSPDSMPRFLPLHSGVYESLQYPLLFTNGEAGWSKGLYDDSPPFRTRTKNRAGTKPVSLLFYCRQRLLSEHMAGVIPLVL